MEHWKGRTTNDGATKQTPKVKDHHKEEGSEHKKERTITKKKQEWTLIKKRPLGRKSITNAYRENSPWKINKANMERKNLPWKKSNEHIKKSTLSQRGAKWAWRDWAHRKWAWRQA